MGYNKSMMKPELLAPAGDIEAGYAALYYGADAVYLGLRSFSARAGATNFSPEELDEFSAYAHSLNKKVYITLNTLIQEKELPEVLRVLDVCSACHVDGLIVQDLGVVRLVKECYPDLVLHASTQMAVHNKQGALALQKMGFQRVVLARELTLKEIQEIAALPGLETEVFIHGALCYAYSGLCLFSSMTTGRSANRGKCAYPCRALFEGMNKKAHFFSMKDMALQEDILKLPVVSLKIEGRKKKALYVAAVVDYYRHILDDKKADLTRQEHIQQIFSRPWTKFHFWGKGQKVIDPDFVGHRGLLIGKTDALINRRLSFLTTHDLARFDGLQIDVPGIEKPIGFSVQELTVNQKNVFQAKAPQRVQVLVPPHTPFIPKGCPIYLASSSAVKGGYDYHRPKPNEFKNRTLVPVFITLTKDKVQAVSGEKQVEIKGHFEPAQNTDKMLASVQNVFNKYKDTDFEPQLHIQNVDAVFVPVSVLNHLRRDLYTSIQMTRPPKILPPVSMRKKGILGQWIIKTDDLRQIALIDTKEFAEIIVELSPSLSAEDLKKFPKNKIRLSLPTIMLNPSDFIPMIQSFLKKGFHKWEISNIGHRELLPSSGIDISWDAPLYMMNTQSMQMAKECGAGRLTLPIEDTLTNLSQTAESSPLPCVLVVYQNVPLFLSRTCIKNACAHCSKTTCVLPLKKDGQVYQAKIQNCGLTLTSQQPFYIDRLRKNVAADFYRIDFVKHTYSPEQVLELIPKIKSGAKMLNVQTGNLNREI